MKKTMSSAAKSSVVRKSSGNVFSDLGFDPDEAEHLRIRSALMATLRQISSVSTPSSTCSPVPMSAWTSARLSWRNSQVVA